MANEITIQIHLAIEKGNVSYRSHPKSFQADLSGDGVGPVPGVVVATTVGLDVAFTGLTTPAWCRITNLDSTNFVEFGIWDGATFHELGEVLAGQFELLRLSRNMTGFRVKADTASVDTLIEAFEA